MKQRMVVASCALLLFLAGCQSGGPSDRAGVELETPNVNTEAPTPIPKAIAKTASLGALSPALRPGAAQSLNKEDRAEIGRAELRAYTAPVGQRITWRNPSSGASGTMAPLRDYYAPNGEYCREFDQTLVVGGKQQQNTVRACQQINGMWKSAP